MHLRPVTEAGSRVPPSDLLDYRAHHHFWAPYCLCTAESIMYVAVRGPYAGEYVAGCATDTCGYLSKSFYVLATIICLRSLGQLTWSAYMH